MQACIEIIRNRKLFFGHLRQMQDKNEIDGVAVFRKSLENFRDSSRSLEYILHCIDASKESLQNAYPDTYILSSTLLGDDMAMWSLYGDGGRGIAISISQQTTGLSVDFVNQHSGGIWHGRVSYGFQESAERLSNIIIEYEKESNLLEDLTSIDDIEIQWEILSNLASSILIRSSSVKDTAFSFENEVRTGVILKLETIKRRELKYQAGNGYIKEYLPISLKSHFIRANMEFVLGPLCDPSQVHALISFLKSEGFSDAAAKVS